jgi:hypothetical protein
VSLGLSGAVTTGMAATPPEKLRPALNAIRQWVADRPDQEALRDSLHLEALEKQLAAGPRASREAVLQLLQRYSSIPHGVNCPQIMEVREILRDWCAVLGVAPLGQLPALCREAKHEFHAIDRQDVAHAKRRLASLLQTLDGNLANTGDDWRRFLKCDVLRRELARDVPNMASLDEIYGRYASGYEGLDLCLFADVRRALRSYLLLSRANGSVTLKSRYEQAVDRLAVQLERYIETPSTTQAAAIGDILAWLEDAIQAASLRATVRYHLAQCNLFAQVSPRLLGAPVVGPFDEQTSLQDVVLSTSVTTNDHTQGRVDLELAPDPRRGQYDVVYRGTTRSASVGYHGRTRIDSSSTTRLEARKRCVLQSDGMAVFPTESHASVSTVVQGVESGYSAARAQGEAWSRTQQELPAAEQAAAQHAEQRTNERMDREIESELHRVNQYWHAKFRDPMDSRGFFPQCVGFHTTREAIHLSALQVDTSRLGALGSPPPLDKPYDLAFQIHESMINNTCAMSLAGCRFSESQYGALLSGLGLASTPAASTRTGGSTWSIHFADQWPLLVQIRDGRLVVTLRGQRYQIDGEDYPGINIALTYRVVRDERGYRLVRDGRLQLFASGLTAEGSPRLAGRQQVLRTVLDRRLRKSLTDVVLTDLELPSPWSKAGSLRMVRCDADHGWLVLAWNGSQRRP